MTDLRVASESTALDPDSLTLQRLMIKAIAKPLTKIVKEEQAVMLDDDPEPLHQMRVGTRRLRTVLALFRPYLILKASVYGDLAKLATLLGAVRDLDVLGLSLQQSQTQLSLNRSEQAQFDQLRQRLSRLRQQHFKKLSAALNRDRYRRLIGRLEHWVHHPQVTLGAQWSAAIALPDVLMPSVHEWLRHPGWLIDPLTTDTADETGDRLLHDLRKCTKRVRYQIDSFADCYGAEVTHYLDELKQIQEILGAQQDSAVLVAFMTQGLGHTWAQHLPSFAAELHRTRQSLAQQWQPIRHALLQAETRQRVRSLLTHPQLNSTLKGGSQPPTAA